VAARRLNWIIPLAQVATASESSVGGKPPGSRASSVQVPGAAGILYSGNGLRAFREDGGLAAVVRLELGRKPLESMRWEEMWTPHCASGPPFWRRRSESAGRHRRAVEALGPGVSLAVRSSALRRFGSGAFAGIHESVVGVIGAPARSRP